MASSSLSLRGSRRWQAQLRRLRSPVTLIAVGVIGLIGYLVLVPLIYMLYSTFYDGHSFTLRFFQEAYNSYNIRRVIWNSLLFGIGSSAVSVVLGTSLAYLVARTDVPLKGLLFVSSLVPLIIPGILYTMSWIFLASPSIGMYNKIAGTTVINIYSMHGMILVEGLHTAPLVFLLMYAAFRNADPSLEESAQMSGARLPVMFRRITLPLVLPALLAATVIMVLRGLEAFEVPALIGTPAGRFTLTSVIFQTLNGYPPAYGEAGSFAFTLLVLTCVGVYFQSRLTRRSRAYATISGKGFRARPMMLRRARVPLAILVLVYFLVAVALPTLVLLFESFQRRFDVVSFSALRHLTFVNYTAILSDSHILHALENSLLLGVGAATTVMFVSAIASWIIGRTKIPGRWLIDSLALSPIMIPGLVMGVALLFVYLRVPLPIYGTLWILFIAYITRYLPYGMRYSSTSVIQVGVDLEEAAHMSGARWWTMFRRVLLPLYMPGLVGGWVYIFIVSIRELSNSILLYSPGREVLSVLIWQQQSDGAYTKLSALGIVMVLIAAALVFVARKLGASVGIADESNKRGRVRVPQAEA